MRPCTPPPALRAATREQIGRPRRCCCTTTSTAGCGRRRSSSWPPRSAHALPDRPTPTTLGRWFAEAADSGSLERYLETFDHTVAVMQTRDAHRRGWPASASRTWPPTASSTPRCATRPSSTSSAGLTLDEVVAAVQRRASTQGVGRQPAAGSSYASCSPRCATRPARREIAELAVALARPRASSGFDIAGAEAGYPPTRHLDAFEYLQRENFHFTIHAGEAFGLPSIWQAIQWCGADRLGHGVRIIDDITVDDDGAVELGRLAAYVRDKRIPLEMCPTSNVQTGAADSIAEHPIGLLHAAAVPGHGQHRQPADERHLDDRARCAPLVEAFGYGLRRPAVVHDQRDEVGVPARSTSGSRSSTTSIKPGYAELAAEVRQPPRTRAAAGCPEPRSAARPARPRAATAQPASPKRSRSARALAGRASTRPVAALVAVAARRAVRPSTASCTT